MSNATSLMQLILGWETRHLLFGSVLFLSLVSAFSFPHHNHKTRRNADTTGNTPGSSPQKSIHPTKIINDNAVEKTVVIAYHKPPNVITSHSDEEALAATKKGPRRTVYEDIQTLQGWVGTESNAKPSDWQTITGIQSKLHAIGRLDCDTTGLLLLTNDGGLVHHVTNPNAGSKESSSSANTITKTYEAIIMGHHDNFCSSFETMRASGVDIGAKYGGMTRPVDHLTVLGYPTSKSTWVSITISEGKNRQVRRMFHSMGSGVMKLKRVMIGKQLSLEGLEEGQWRILSEEEVSKTLGWDPRPILVDNKSTLLSRNKKGKRNQRTDNKTTLGKPRTATGRDRRKKR